MQTHNKIDKLLTTSSSSNAAANVTMRAPNVSASAASAKMSDEENVGMIPEVMRLAPGDSGKLQRLIVQSGASGKYLPDIEKIFGTPQDLLLLANPDQRPYKQWQQREEDPRKQWQQCEQWEQWEEDKDKGKGDKDNEYKAREWEPGVGALGLPRVVYQGKGTSSSPYHGADVRYKGSKTPVNEVVYQGVNEVVYLKHHPGGFHQSSSSSDRDPKMKAL